MNDNNKSFHFFNKDDIKHLSIKDKTYKMEKKSEMVDVLTAILMRKIDLNQSDRNELLEEIRSMIGSIKI